MAELKKMKVFYKQSLMTKPKRNTYTSNNKVSTTLINKLSREANKAWGLKKGSRTRTQRFGMTSNIVSKGLAESKKMLSSASSKLKKYEKKILSENKKYGKKVNENLGFMGKKISDEYVIPAGIASLYVSRKVVRGGRKIMDKAYRLTEKEKKLNKEKKKVEKQLKNLTRRDEILSERISKLRGKLEEVAHKTKQKTLRRGLRMGGRKSYYRPVVYSPVAARAQQSLVIPCGGGWWN